MSRSQILRSSALSIRIGRIIQLLVKLFHNPPGVSLSQAVILTAIAAATKVKRTKIFNILTDREKLFRIDVRT